MPQNGNVPGTQSPTRKNEEQQPAPAATNTRQSNTRASLTSSLRAVRSSQPKGGNPQFAAELASPTAMPQQPPNTFPEVEPVLRRASTQILTPSMGKAPPLPPSGTPTTGGPGATPTRVAASSLPPAADSHQSMEHSFTTPAQQHVSPTTPFSHRTWLSFFTDGVKFPSATAAKYDALFKDEEMPPPSMEFCRGGIDNDLLLSIGITLGGHRARILAECRNLCTANTPRFPISHHHSSENVSSLAKEDSEQRPKHEPVRALPKLYRENNSAENSSNDDDEGEKKGSQRELSAGSFINDIRTAEDVEDEPPSNASRGLAPEQNPEDEVTISTFKSKRNVHQPFTWVDMTGRDKDRSEYRDCLQDISDKYNFSDSLLVDIDLTLALPQVITSPEEPNQFLIILRVATEGTDIEEDSLHLLTNRWMIAVNMDNFTMVTIHRADCLSLAKLRATFYDIEWSFTHFLCKILDDSLLAYIDALHESEYLLDQYESVMLRHSVGGGGGDPSKHVTNPHIPKTITDSVGDPSKLTRQRMNQLLYHLHRRCSVYSRMLSLMQAALESAFTALQLCSPEYAEQMSRSCGELAVKAESLHDNCQNLLNLHLSLVSFRTNELMGILTTFSAFFIPLTFICGLYGMNFVNMPELTYHNGYYFCLGAMGLIVIVVWVFFRHKGLL